MATKINPPQKIDIVVPSDKASRTKMLRSIANTGFMQVWEGSIRSGKTVTALISFARYVIDSPATIFLMSGRTVAAIERNAILSDYGLLNIIGLDSSSYHTEGKSKVITFSVRRDDGSVVRKKILVMGANDIKSFKALRGATTHGWFADEINMHDKSFVAEGLNRTALSPDRKHFWTLNPDNPHHWIYTDYLDNYDAMTKAERKALGGYRWWHYIPKDNPMMSAEALASLEAQFPKGSYLYRRYILGERCVAEGLVYPDISDQYFRDLSADRKDVDVRYCAIDFGANHPTTMVFGGMYNGNRQDWRIIKEYFDEKSGKTTYDHYVQFLAICKELGANPNRITIAIDPSALTLRTEFVNRGLTVVKAKNEVLAGIEYVRRVVTTGHLLFDKSLVNLRREFGSYRWDEKKSEKTGIDSVVKIGDDVVDALRYFAMTFIRNYVR